MSTSPAAGPAAEILTIGDELCRGEIVDTNSAWLAERLTDLGLHVRWRSSTTDDPADLAAALSLAAARARVVVTSGGLGPTEDDRTVDVIAGLLGVTPAVDEAARERMERRFAERGMQVTPNNLRQVRVPAGAEVLRNRAGLAPGFRVRLGGAEVFVTPGVPREMKSIWHGGEPPTPGAAPSLERAPGSGSGSGSDIDSGNGGGLGDGGIHARLEALLAATGGDGRRALAVARRVWRVAAMGESHVDHRLRGLLDGVLGATLHFRIAYPDNLVTVVARRPTRAEAEAVLDGLDGAVRERIGDHVYGTGEATLAEVVGRRLRDRGATLATAESCTGGLLGDLVTDVPGSSDYYLGGVVAYSNALKQRLLGVREETLAAHGAVSEACVREMAEGVRRATGASYGLATSGIAGPGGGTADKPVGLVHLAVAGPRSTEAQRVVWPNPRRLVKQMAAQATLFLLYRQLAALR